jgi:hypothetical protein
MLGLDTSLRTEFDIALHNFYVLYGSTINSILQKLWNQENLQFKSRYHQLLNQYQIAFNIASIIYLDYKRVPDQDLQTLVSGYGLTDAVKALQCNGISLSDVVACFNIPYLNTNTPQISNTDIEGTFVIEDIYVDIPIVENIDFNDYSLFKRGCTSDGIIFSDYLINEYGDYILSEASNKILRY